ncbi:hypothetical protein GGF40_002680 [Coemansia sp. RSA 1286]|nr:hypothetical protein GGF40_002680 [Coemansia sp. RSA 1286]
MVEPRVRQYRQYLAARSATDRLGEHALRNKLFSKLETSSEAGREEIWGFYRRIASEGISWDTTKQVLDLVAKDPDSTRALMRIAQALDELAKRRGLLETEISDIQKLCAKLENPTAFHADKALTRHASEDKDTGLKSSVKGITTSVSQNQKPIGSVLPPEQPSATCSSETLEALLDRQAISLDQQAVQRAYFSALDDGALTEISTLTRLMQYCPLLGYISGIQFLAQIEEGLRSRHPNLLDKLQPDLIRAYSKLGSLDDAQRCYRTATREGCEDSLDWSLCLALFRGNCQKKGQELFDTHLVARGRATPEMFGMLLHEYAMMRNAPGAYSLLETMKHAGIEPTDQAIYSLAQTCAADPDIERGTSQLADVVAFNRSWGRSLDINFVTGLLKGYSASSQNEMFDAVASKLSLDSIDPGRHAVHSVIMSNAARRRNRELVHRMLRQISINYRQGAPQAVRSLCAVGDVNMARTICGTDTDRFPTNNITSNMRLELSLADVSSDPLRLVSYVKKMVADGFTPSFRHFIRLVDTLWLRGGVDLALNTFDHLSAAGVPISIGLLLKVMQLRLQSSNPYSALDTFDVVCDRLRDIDVGQIRLHKKSIHDIMEMLINQKGILPAFEAFELFQKFPVSQSRLPYSLFIEYFIRNNHKDRAHGLIRHVVQHDIRVEHQVAKSCSRYFLLESTVSDTVNFLRYLQRIRCLEYVEYDIIDSVLYRCAEAGHMVDFQWVVEAAANHVKLVPAWGRLVDRLAVRNKHALFVMARSIIMSGDHKKSSTIDLLKSCVKSPYRAVAAEMVLKVISENGLRLASRAACFAYSLILKTWVDVKNRSYQNQEARLLTLPYLSEILFRYVPLAISGGINMALLIRTFRAVSSLKHDSYKDCLAFLRTLPPHHNNTVLLGAIATGCAESNSIKGIDAVLKEANHLHIKPTSELLTSIMQAYRAFPAPSNKKARRNQEVLSENHHSLDSSTHSGEGLDKEAQSLERLVQETPGSSEQSLALSEDHAAGPVIEFRKSILARVLRVWDEFEYHGLVIRPAAYTIAAQVCIRCHEYQKAEWFFRDMAEKQQEHDIISMSNVLLLYLRWNKPQLAFSIFGAMGDQEKCKQFEDQYPGLSKIERNSVHYSLIIDYCLTSKREQNAMYLFRAMHELDIGASPWLYSKVLRYLADANMKQDFVKIMRQVSRLGVSVDREMLSVIKEYQAKISKKTV